MHNDHIPGELLDKLDEWLFNNLFSRNLEDKKEAYSRLKIIKQTKNNLKCLSIEISQELLDEEMLLEERLSLSEDEEGFLQELSHRLNSTANQIKRSIKNTRKPKNKGTKGPRKQLRVTLPNTEVIQEYMAVDTYITTLDRLGFENIVDNPVVMIGGYPGVSLQENPNSNNAKFVEGYYIETCTSTEQKGKYLEKYAEYLGVNLKVELV